jgi:hypothetical protein
MYIRIYNIHEREINECGADSGWQGKLKHSEETCSSVGLFFNTQLFGDWIPSPSSGKNLSPKLRVLKNKQDGF